MTPHHIALIMDGNRRWARERNLPIAVGHSTGAKRLEEIIAYAAKKHIPHLTFWAFSTENWNREKTEIEILMGVFRDLFKRKIKQILMKNGVKLVVLGELDRFPDDIAKAIRDIVATTKNNQEITVNIALNYGGRLEIVRAVNKILEEKPAEITEESFANYLYTAGQPDPDLIIRTGGEQRLSGFLPWQGVYSELYFPQIYWPDFTTEEFDKALEEFENRNRRFGK